MKVGKPLVQPGPAHGTNYQHDHDQCSDQNWPEPIVTQRLAATRAYLQPAVAHGSAVSATDLPWSPLRLATMGTDNVSGL